MELRLPVLEAAANAVQQEDRRLILISVGPIHVVTNLCVAESKWDSPARGAGGRLII